MRRLRRRGRVTPPVKANNPDSSSDDEPLQKKKQNDSSSESDLENYLKPADQIDLSSSFFAAPQAKPDVGNFDAIEKGILAGIRCLSDSESDLEDECTQPEVTTTHENHFESLNAYNKKLEDVKKHVEKYNSEKAASKENNLDIGSLLAKGEGKTSMADVFSSLHSSDFESLSESEKEDWEEVEIKEERPMIPKEGVNIHVEMPDVVRKKKKGVDLMAALKRRINRVKKEMQVLIHKVHLLCWIAHGNYVNKILNSHLLLGLAFSLLPSQHCLPPTRLDLTYLQQILSWYGKAVSVKNSSNIEKQQSLEESLQTQLGNKEARDYKSFVYLFICVLRSLGLNARLVMSLQVEPLRPPVSELCSLSNKTHEVSKKTKVAKLSVVTPKKQPKISNLSKKQSRSASKDDNAKRKQENFANKEKLGVQENKTRDPANKIKAATTSKKLHSSEKKKPPKILLNDNVEQEKEGQKKKVGEVRRRSLRLSSKSPTEFEEKEETTKNEAARHRSVRFSSKSPKSLDRKEEEKRDGKKILRESTHSRISSTDLDRKEKEKAIRKDVPCRSREAEEAGGEKIPHQSMDPEGKEKRKTVQRRSVRINSKDLDRREEEQANGKDVLRRLPEAKEAGGKKIRLLPSGSELQEKIRRRSVRINSKDLDRQEKEQADVKDVLGRSREAEEASGVKIPRQSTDSERKEEVCGESDAKSIGKSRKPNLFKVKVNLKKIKKSRDENIKTTEKVCDAPLIPQLDGATDPDDCKQASSSAKWKSPAQKLKTDNPKTVEEERSGRNAARKLSLKKLRTPLDIKLSNLRDQARSQSSSSDSDRSRFFASPKKQQLDVRDDIMALVKKGLSQEAHTARSKLIKHKRRANDDSDSDYVPTPLKLKRSEEKDDFKEKVVKVKRRVPMKKDLAELEERRKREKEEEKKKKGINVWLEVFVEDEEKWISVDVGKGTIHCVNELFTRATHPVSYILSWDNNSYVKDITKRYCVQWNTVTRKLRVDPSWWNSALKSFAGPKTARDREEDDELMRQQLEKPLPTTISEYKDHPLYVLKRHLLKFQAIYPPDAPTLGFVRGEGVYSRDCVYVLHSRELWLKEAKVVKLGEQPYKIVKARPKYDKLSNTIITDKPLEIFGIWQVEDYVPPTAENGVVPRNAYGNVELFKPCMLPKGTVHLQLPGLNKTARKMNVDCAPAVTGFDFHGGWNHAVFDGYIVCEEYADQLIAAWYLEQEEAEKRAEEKIEKRVYDNWRKLIKGLLIRERLKARYNFGEPSKPAHSKRNKSGKLCVKKRVIKSDSESD